ncbi:hypothetical protein [Roseimicrobium sp. ORNL1]|uniref:hypothetical protein n=1 Tax=Roseimicrobium sp. ORNL1 TaxID=2711231 RepID=UPI0013E12B7A|nr:hypothetical protein [Roseimicrobium sp. ORNL1]QIF03417.1 hypothetical protein G5S37_18425 [Roseimicrobium sp. ORNL1]
MKLLPVCLLALTCTLSTALAEESQPLSFEEITSIFHKAFVLQGKTSVAKLVQPDAELDEELDALFQNKPTKVELYPPTDEDVGSIRRHDGLDWPHRPIAKLFVTTDGPKGKDFTEAWFTVGLHEGKPVLMTRNFQKIPDWRR